MTQQVASSMLAFDAGSYGFRNKLINGGMVLAQRGTSFVNSLNAYGLDRWRSYGGPGNVTMSQVANSAYATGYAMQFGRTSGETLTNGIGIVSGLETKDSLPLAGKTVTLSFKAARGANYSAANYSLTAFVNYGTGTDQSPTAMTGATAVVNAASLLTTTPTTYSVSGAVPSNATQIAVGFSFTPVGTAGAADYFQLGEVQLEIGPAVSAFDVRPQSIELALAQRYYQALGGRYTAEVAGHGFSVAGNTGLIVLPLKATMRAIPVVTLSAAADWNLTSATTSAAVSTFTYAYSSPDVVELDITASGSPGWTASNALVMRAASTTNARIKIDAEL